MPEFTFRLFFVFIALILAACTKPTADAPSSGTPTGDSVVSLSGDGASAMTIEFGQLPSSGTVEKTITLSNPTNDVITGFQAVLSNPQFQFKGGTFPGVGGTCNATLAAKSSCQVVITYSEVSGSAFLKRSLVLISLDAQLILTFQQNGITRSSLINFRLYLQPTNHAPLAQDQTLATQEDAALSITLTATDSDSDSLSYSIESNPTHGTLTGTAPNLTYTPATEYSGTDSFSFKVSDGKLESTVATVSITISVVNDAPVAQNQSISMNQDTERTVLLTALDPEGDALTYSILTAPGHGTLSGSGATKTYRPTAGYSGSDSFVFRADDGHSNSVATIAISVIDTVPPTIISFSIENGAVYTKKSEITLSPQVTGATQMYVTNISGCNSGGTWEEFKTSKSWTLQQTNTTAIVYAKFRDATNNESNCVSASIIHDNTAPPAVSGLGSSSHPINNKPYASNSVTLSWQGGTESDFLKFECSNSWYGAAETCAPNVLYQNVPDGYQSVSIVSIDKAGNRSPSATIQFVVDTTPPSAPRNIYSTTHPFSNVEYNNSSPIFNWTQGTDVNLEKHICRIDTGSWQDCVSQSNAAYSGISDGPHTLEVKAQDKAGNTSATASFGFSIDAYCTAERKAATPFAGGDGTSTAPYIICAPEQLKTFTQNSSYWTMNFVIRDEIDVTALASGLSGGVLLSGVLDGKNHCVTGYVGGPLLDLRDSAKLTNIHFKNYTVSGSGGLVSSIARGASATNIRITNGTLNVPSFARGMGGFVGSNFGTINGLTGDVKISGNSGGMEIGGVAGYNFGTLDNVALTGEITLGYTNAGSDFIARVGGLVGDQMYYTGTEIRPKIMNSKFSGNVSAMTGNWVGGITGTSRGDIYNCQFEGTIKASDTFGGITGANDRSEAPWEPVSHHGIIRNSSAQIQAMAFPYKGRIGGITGSNGGEIYETYSTGTISGNGLYTDGVGGLVGYNFGIIQDCYSRVDVSAYFTSGGLVASTTTGGQVSRCYSTGRVSGTEHPGGLVGLADVAVQNSFWDVNSSGINRSASGTGLTTNVMKTSGTYSSAGWDFTTVWNIDPNKNNGYPYLRRTP